MRADTEGIADLPLACSLGLSEAIVEQRTVAIPSDRRVVYEK